METYCADKFDKFDKIDNNNLKIDNYRLLTTYPFIDFYRFPMQLTNFYRFYQLLSIELVGIFWAFLRHAFKKKDNKRFFPPSDKHETYNHVGYRKLIHLHINLDDEALKNIHHLYNYLMRK